MKTPPLAFTEENFVATILGKKTETRRLSAKPKCAVGDRVYLCEPTRIVGLGLIDTDVPSVFVKYFWAEDDSVNWNYTERKITPQDYAKIKARKIGTYFKQPPRFMLKSFARYHADITSVHQEKLLEITEEGAIAEGIRKPVDGLYFDYLSSTNQYTSPIESYLSEIAKLNKQTFNAVINENPLVWVYEYDFVKE